MGVKGVAEALDNNKEENIETKGVKAHFTLDDSGILTCTLIESVFEKTISVEEQEKLEAEKEKEKDDTWSKLGDTISQFFSTDDKDKDKDAKDTDGDKDEQEKAKAKEEKRKRRRRKRIKRRKIKSRRSRRSRLSKKNCPWSLKDDTWSKLGDTISQFFSTDD